MSAKLALKAKEAFMQYSKKMCTRVTIFWMIYRIVNFVVVILRPDAAKFLVDLTAGVDTIMMVNIGFYSGNSISEKGIIAFSKHKSAYSNNDTEDNNNNNDIEENEQDKEKDNG